MQSWGWYTFCCSLRFWQFVHHPPLKSLFWSEVFLWWRYMVGGPLFKAIVWENNLARQKETQRTRQPREVISKFISDGGNSALVSAVKLRGRERKGHPEIIQKFRLRSWPISSADFPLTPMEGEHHRGPCWEKDFGEISGGPLFSRPLCFTSDSNRVFSGPKTIHKATKKIARTAPKNFLNNSSGLPGHYPVKQGFWGK